MKRTILKYKMEIIGFLAGAVIGVGYWFFVGCSSGTCAITSNPVNSSVYGAMMGGLLLNIIKDTSKKNNTQHEHRTKDQIG